MSIYNQTGVKISQYQTAQVDNSIRPNKLALEHFLISYAPSYYGTSTINKNFKVPVNLLRNDFIGYVGIKNAKSEWRNTIKLWCGDWSSSDLPNSYICTWTKEDIEKYPNDFITDKHADEKGCDKIFIINNAPLPETEEAGLDPNPNTKKIVTKDYVDSRFNGSPKVYCKDTTLRIRSYPCVYIFENESLLNIDITDTDENGNTLKDLIGDKCLDFIIRVPTFSLNYYEDPYRTDFTITHNGKGCRWGFKNELIMMLDRARQENVKDLWFKCYAEYINGEFIVNCTNGLNVLENEIITGAAGVVTEIDETYNGKEVPTEEAVVNYVHLHTDKDDIHVTQDDKDYWNSIQTSVENLTGYQFDEKYETTYFQLFDINSPLSSYDGIGFETIAHDTGYLESIEVACRLGGKNPTNVSTWAIIWRIVDDNSFEKLGCSDNSVIHNIDTTEEFNVKYNFHKSIISLSEGDRIRITYHSIDQKHTNSTSVSDCSLGCMAVGSTDKESYYKILNTNAIRENYCPRHKIAIQGNKSLKSLIELTRTELYNEVSSKSDFISTNLNNETERAKGAEEALGGRIDQLSQNTTNSIDAVHERIDGVDNRIDGIDERIDNLDSNKSSNGITIEQTDGKITSLAVQSATVNEDGTLKDIDNVITGTEVKKLINNVTTEFSKAGVNYKIETSLPKPASSQYKGWIYLIPKSTSVENNEYIEFICVDKDENTWAWEQIGTTAITLPAAGDYLSFNEETNKYNVDVSDKIEDNADTVPTTKATMDFVNEQKIWDLNKFVYDCIRKSKDSSKYEWVKEYVLNSTNIYIDEEFETKNEWIEYVKAGNDPYNPLIFINDRYDVSISNDSSTSTGYSKIGEFVKKMFRQLDEDAGKEWMSDDSFSKKYLKTGLSIKYITYLSIDGNNTDLPIPTDFSTIANLNSDYVYPSYTISIYTSPNFLDLNDAGQVSLQKPDFNYGSFSFDSLTKNKNWNYLISEQEMKITRNFLKNLINDSTNKLNAGKLIEVSEETISVKTSDEIINDADVTVASKVLFDTLVNKEDYIKNTIGVRDVIEEIGDYNYNSITNTSSSSSGVYVGICYRPQKNATVKSFQISEINLNEGRYLHVYKYNSGNLEYITVSNGTQTITDRNELFSGHALYDAKWQFDGFTVKENEEYHLFLKQEQTQNASNVESRIKVYPISNSEYVLDNSGHRDKSWKANFTVEGKEINISTTENIETENLTDYTIPTEFYGEFIRNKHDISYLYDKKNVISFNDGKLIIKDGDSNEIEYTKDLQKAVISRYTFRQPNSSTTVDGFRVDYVNDFTEFNKRDFNVAAGAAGHGGSAYYHERDVFAPKYDNDLGDDGKPLMSTLQNVINGEGMFLRANLTTFNDDIRCLMNGKNMFAYNKKLTNFRSALPSLTLGDKMFLGAGIEIFNTKLPSLASAECMFRLCLNLKYVNTCIPNLCFAQGMFGYCLNLKHVDLSENSGMCLYNADDMFIGCPNLTHCKLNLSYLETGENMFGVGSYSASTDSSHEIQGHRITKGQSYGNSKLDIESIEYMANTIKDWSNPYTDSNLNINTTPHKITLGIDCRYDNYTSSVYKEHIDKIKSRGWQVTLYDNTGIQINH